MATRTPEIDLSDELVSEFGGNASYVAELFARYRTNPPPWTTSGGTTSAAAIRRARAGQARGGARSRGRAAPRVGSGVSAAGPAVEGERHAIRGGALRIAENMEASLGVPTATTQRQIPVNLADENRRLINEERAASEQPKISFTHVFGWAIVRALEAFPGMNDAFDASSGEAERVRRKNVNLGLAVDVAKPDGSRTLLVPNVKGVDAMTFAQFAAAADDVVTRARTGKIKLSDFEGTTISLDEPGTLGTTASVPRLMPGQGAIIATARSSTGPSGRCRRRRSRTRDRQGGHVHVDVRPSDHPGRGVGTVPGARRGAASAAHGFYDDIFAALGIPSGRRAGQPDRTAS